MAGVTPTDHQATYRVLLANAAVDLPEAIAEAIYRIAHGGRQTTSPLCAHVDTN